MGGGVIRAAAKVAGFTVPTGVAVSSAARRAASLRPAASTTEDVKLVASNLDDGLQRLSSSSVDDWVFAGGEDDAVVYAAGSMPRVVFGGVPSLQEAKEATSELSIALEKTFLSSPTSAESDGSIDVDHDSSLHLSNTQIVESNPFLGSEVAMAPAVPSPTMMAFKFLKESPVAQNVVASIACDPNVWNAVLQNEELQGFLKSQRTCVVSSDVNSAELASDSTMHDQSSTTIFNNLSEDGESGRPEGRFMNILDKIKSAVVDMMTGLSDFFVNMFGSKASANSDGISKLGTEAVMQASMMGLAVMAILVILLKRA